MTKYYIDDLTLTDSTAAIGDRAVWIGGYDGSTGGRGSIDYFAISTIGNASDFGDITTDAYRSSSFSNSTNDRGICAGHFNSGAMHYITISSPGNATSFGSLISNSIYRTSCSNAIYERGIVAAGSSSNINIEYITINSAGNGTSFGSCIVRYYGSGTSNFENQRGIFTFNSITTDPTVIEYITINSTGNATTFGEQPRRWWGATTSNGTNERAVMMGNNNSLTDPHLYRDEIKYLTINSLGDAQDFGDLIDGRYLNGGTSNAENERAVTGGGRAGISIVYTTTIEYITINSTGNATDFGDLTSLIGGDQATSNA